jgi:DNA-directed RNA polymerase subunit beta
MVAEGAGVVDFVDAKKIVIKYDTDEERKLLTFDNDIPYIQPD